MDWVYAEAGVLPRLVCGMHRAAAPHCCIACSRGSGQGGQVRPGRTSINGRGACRREKTKAFARTPHERAFPFLPDGTCHASVAPWFRGFHRDYLKAAQRTMPRLLGWDSHRGRVSPTVEHRASLPMARGTRVAARDIISSPLGIHLCCANRLARAATTSHSWGHQSG